MLPMAPAEPDTAAEPGRDAERHRVDGMDCAARTPSSPATTFSTVRAHAAQSMPSTR